jgi:DNA-binding NarL/FixJ family response regulator
LSNLKIKIAIVDDSIEVLNNLESYFSDNSKIEIVFACNNGKEFIKSCRKLKAAFLPEIVILDIDMPLMDGLETILQTRLFNDSIKFLMFTVFDDDEKIFEAIKNGASGYLLKEASKSKIEESLLEMHEFGAVPMSPSVARKALKMLSESKKPEKQAFKENEMLNSLSIRETEILKLLILGKRYKEIAEETNISPNTVRNHIANVYKKMQVTSNLEAMNLAKSKKWFEM